MGLNENDTGNNKKLFSFLKNSRRDQQGTSPLEHEGTLHTDTKKKSNIFNHQFNSVFTPKEPLSLARLAKMRVQDLVDAGDLPSDTPSDIPQDTTIPMPNIDISLNGLLKLLNNLKPGKAAGPDRLKPLLLKELREEIGPIIKVIFERSLHTGQLPAEWVKANVMPVFKKGDKTQASNYRPISLTCILCKVLEHILASNIVKHLDEQGVLYDLQHGFREKRSCETQLVMLIEDLARNASVGKQTDIILLDFSKAFDKVNHSKLLWKLHSYGIRGQVLSWIKAFLGNRSQRVVIDGEESDSIPVTSGVPQGSVLGPILFLIYINDLPDEVCSQVRLFADDTALYLTIESEQDSSTLQNDLDRLSAWETKWDMEFNPSKCQVVQVTGSRRPLNTSYTLHGQVLETVTCAKYLGVDISNGLSWNPHVDRIVGSANRTLGFIRRNIKTKMPRVREKAYNTLVRPQLEYASAVWDPHTKERISQIEQVQRRAARWTVSN
ncbi:MAG: reverse transcriptase family protein, partial [Candidatus Thiodiazotropha sp.]